MTKVAVIGPGALGCYFAARLSLAGIKTYLVDYQEKRAALLHKQGIRVESVEGNFEANPSVTSKLPVGLHLILLLTKAYTTASLRFPTDAPVLTLQNGLGNAESLTNAVGSGRVMAGSTAEAVTWLAPGHIRHVASGETVFGAWTSCNTALALETLTQAGFNARVTTTPGQVIWEKAAINAGINPLTAILNVPNGALLEKRETRELMRDLVVEATKVAGTEGYRFSRSMVEEAEQLCEMTKNNISSMLQDIRQKKRTENDAISGEILRRAQAAMLPTPRTRVIYQLMRGLETR